jgi:hypothetical protein
VKINARNSVLKCKLGMKLQKFCCTVANNKFWSSMPFQNLVKLSHMKTFSQPDYAHIHKASKKLEKKRQLMSYNMMMGCYDIYHRFTMEHFPLRQRMTLTTKIYCSRLYQCRTRIKLFMLKLLFTLLILKNFQVFAH